MTDSISAGQLGVINSNLIRCGFATAATISRVKVDVLTKQSGQRIIIARDAGWSGDPKRLVEIFNANRSWVNCAAVDRRRGGASLTVAVPS